MLSNSCRARYSNKVLNIVCFSCMADFVGTKITPYAKLMRIHKPIGFFLLLWPTLMALWIAGYGHPDPLITIIFILGTFIMRSAGCVINDLFDQRFDGYVTRTQNRPLVQNQISCKEAKIVFIILLSIAFLLVLQLNIKTILLACVAAVLAMIYPLMKRLISAPQAVLGIAFAWGIPMAFMALQETIPFSAVLLFCATVLWTIAYDTEYAMVDRAEDIKIGIKSSAIWFGEWDTRIIFLLNCAALLLFIYLGCLLTFNFFFYGSLIATGLLFLYQYFLIRDRDPKKCFQAFLNNNYVGLVLFFGIFSQKF